MRAVEHLYGKAVSAVQMNSGMKENGSEQQLVLGKVVFSHPLASNVFSKGLCLLLWKMKRFA